MPQPIPPLPVAGENQEALAVISLFSKRLNNLLDRTGFVSAKDGRYGALGAKYGVSRQQAYRWGTGLALPAPHLLLRIADDFNCTLDWLLGRDQYNSSGTIPLFSAKTPVNDCKSMGFYHRGCLSVEPALSEENGRLVAVKNWCTSLEPNLLEEDWLLVRLGDGLVDGGIYIIRTATTWAVSVVATKMSASKPEVTFFRRTAPNHLFSATYNIGDVSLNKNPHIDAEWRGAGVLLVGKLVSVTRSLEKLGAFTSLP